MCRTPEFKSTKEQVESPQKGRRQYAGLPWQILQGGAAIFGGGE